MKLSATLLAAACLLAAPAFAQSTMPAYGANTPKGEVAKTDASINARSSAKGEDSTRQRKMAKGGHKMKMKHAKGIM